MHFSICDYMLDMVQNGIEAGAGELAVSLIESGGRITVKVIDNGKGMTAVEVERLKDPYFTDGKKHKRTVGLGVPFLAQALEGCGGELRISSEPGKGTEIVFAFPAEHIDTPPLGDPADLWFQAMIFDGDYEMIINRQKGKEMYTVRRSECAEALGGLNDGVSVKLLRQFIRSQEEALTGPSISITT